MNSPTDSAAVEALEPSVVWRFFAGIAATPRPSKQEGRIRAHIKATVEAHDLKVTEDRLGNMVIDVPASPGCESVPLTVLQAHVDMVCEKNTGTAHDFETDPIRLIIDSNADGRQIVRADDTTLGADNGIGAALVCYKMFEEDDVSQTQSWQSFHFSDWNAARELDKVQESLKSYQVQDDAWPIIIIGPNEIEYPCGDYLFSDKGL